MATNKSDDNTLRNFGSSIQPNGSTVTWSISVPKVEKGLEPEKIIYNRNTTIVIWNDGTKTVSTAASDDFFDPEVGFAICLMKKMFGKKVYGRRLYRRMIMSATAQDEMSKSDLEEYGAQVRHFEGLDKAKKVNLDDEDFSF